MSIDTLDMSTLIRDHTFAAGDFAILRADGKRPVTLDFKASNVTPPASGRTLIMQARRGVEEVWGIRMLPSARLLLQPGTGSPREAFYGYVTDLSLGVSFNPLTGSWSVVVRETDGVCESFNMKVHNSWSESGGDYEILVGAPAEYADKTPLGWTIDCSFRCGPAEAQQQRAFVPPAHKGLGELRDLARTVIGIDGAERHWEAMLALASGRYGAVAINPGELAAEAAQLVTAHEAWRREQS